MTDLNAADIGFIDNCEKLFAEAETVQQALDNLCDIDASDIPFENNCEKLFAAAETVQQALDNLCDIDASDIPFENNCEKLFAAAATVQQALDNLCDIDASDISYTPGCEALKDIENVQGAIDTLCEMELGKGCAITVGEGGQYNTIMEAFKGLSSAEDLVICLLPGTHIINEPLDIQYKGCIKITGCGGSTSVIRIQSDQLSLSANEILLRDLGFTVKSETGAITLAGELVSAQGCVFERKYARKDAPPLVSIKPLDGSGTAVLRWSNNQMVAAWRKKNFKGELKGVILPEYISVGAGLEDMEELLHELEMLTPSTDESPLVKIVEEMATSILEMPSEVRTARSAQPPEAIKDLSDVPIAISETLLRGNPKPIVIGALEISPREAVTNFFKALEKPDLTPAEISKELTHVVKTLFESGPGEALALSSNKVGGWIQNNVIDGYVSLMRDLPGSYISSPIFPATSYSDTVKSNVKSNLNLGQSLKLQGNEVNQVRTRAELQGEIFGFESITISDNIFRETENSFIGGSLSMSGNQFPWVSEEEAAAVVLGYSGVFIGNQSDNRSAQIMWILNNKAEVANLLTFSEL